MASDTRPEFFTVTEVDVCVTPDAVNIEIQSLSFATIPIRSRMLITPIVIFGIIRVPDIFDKKVTVE